MSNLLRSNLLSASSKEPSSTLAQISLMVYEAVVLLQKQQPEWMLEKYRQKDLLPYRSRFINQLQTSLEKIQTRGSIALTVQRFLQKTLNSNYFDSTSYQELLEQIDAEFLSRTTDRSPEKEAISILLLDAENIKLNTLEEGMLLQFSTYPVKVKIAFANWRGMGRHDLDFHDRSYQMIHVPTGKNAADIQMTAIGASLFLQYPHAKEVFVCSNDAHLITLCNLLQTQGWKVYALRKWGIRLTLTDWTNGRVKVFSIAESAFDPHVELEQKLAKLLLALTARNPNASVSMGALASQFKKHYDSAVTDVMRSWHLGSNFLKFLRSCETFRLERTDSDWHVAIRPIVPNIAPPLEDASIDRATPV